MTTPQKLVVVGQGYVGLPLAMRAVEAGYDVVGVENDERRAGELRSGRSYVEDIPAERVAAALNSGRFRPTIDYRDTAEFDVAVITVPTPLLEGSPDLSYVVESGRSLAPFVRPGALVVLESTTYPGTTEDTLAPLLETGSGLRAGADFRLAYSPERIDPGNRTWTLETTPKVVGGIDEPSLHAAVAFYRNITADVVPVSSPRVAELAKLLENTFRHVNIALVNELAIAARELGIDVWEVIDAASTKPFGFMRFTPGPGVGGHCLPIDPKYLSWHVKQATGQSFRFVELAQDVNDHMPDYVVQRLILALNERGRAVKGAEILLLGLAYKKNSSDAREAPASRIVELLTKLGANLTAVDDYVAADHLADQVHRVTLTPEVARAADAVLLITDHDDVDYRLLEKEAQWIIDCRHRVAGEQVEYL
jgi:UDP-N-acetyl-D-glucosamine dehydrogenase